MNKKSNHRTIVILGTKENVQKNIDKYHRLGYAVSKIKKMEPRLKKIIFILK
jgi:ABC-type Fe3+-citrate transport system substrate-binding protein